jgi:HSP20 family protein
VLHIAPSRRRRPLNHVTIGPIGVDRPAGRCDLEGDHMAGLLKREQKPVDVFDRFDRMFDEWMKGLSVRRPMLFGREWAAEDVIRVDEFRENGDLVVRAELPGIDPDKDVELSVSDGVLHIDAERREEERVEEKGYLRHEIRAGSFSRSLPLPAGVSEADVTASYKDGILEVRIPTPEPEPAKKIEISKS